MAPPKKNAQKMDLASFLADDTLGGNDDSWGGDYTPDITTQGNVLDIGSDIQVGALPDKPPYTAKINNFPQGSTEEALEDFFVKGMGITNPVEDIESFRAPRDQLGEMRGFAFITFTTRDLLEKALTLNDHFIGSSKVYVSVATPPKDKRPRREDTFDFAGARGEFQQQSGGSRYGGDRYGGDRDQEERRPRREDQSFDFAGVRGSVQQRAPETRERFGGDRERFGGDREERRPRREEQSFDFAGVRGSMQQQQAPVRDQFREERHERRPRREEPSLDFTAVRGSLQQKEPEHRPTFTRKPKKDDGLDFTNIRGTAVQQAPGAKKPAAAAAPAKKQDAPLASTFAMLAVEDDDEE